MEDFIKKNPEFVVRVIHVIGVFLLILLIIILKLITHNRKVNTQSSQSTILSITNSMSQLSSSLSIMSIEFKNSLDQMNKEFKITFETIINKFELSIRDLSDQNVSHYEKSNKRLNHLVRRLDRLETVHQKNHSEILPQIDNEIDG
jgi:hypothetical protein